MNSVMYTSKTQSTTSVFVGRKQELAQLTRRLDEALSGQGKVCFVAGQAGSGKTFLAHQFLERALAANPKLVVVMGTCNAQTGIGDPYLPFREALAMLIDETAAHEPFRGPAARRIAPENSERLQSVAARSVQVLVEAAPELVGSFIPGGALLGALGKATAEKVGWLERLEDAVKQKAWAAEAKELVAEQSRIFEQYTAFLRRLAVDTPLILFLDDLQWADNASINLLFHLARHLETSRVLILGAYRPNDVALGRNGDRHPLESVVNELTRYYGDISIDLDAIPEESGHQFVAALLDAERNYLGESFRQALYHQTGGHALFTVELLRAMEERGDLVRDADGCWVEGPSLDWSTLPARVEGVIEERVGRLPRALKEMLQVGSVEGEEFTAEVIARIEGMEERQAVRHLSRELQRTHRLVHGVGLVRFGNIRLSRYRFTHNLFQDYFYNTLSDAERVYLHQGVGQALEALFADQTEEVAAQLARHFEEASTPSKAARYRLQAGDRARRLSAQQEAATHLSRGLDLVAAMPAGPERTRLELDLQVSQGKVYIAMLGYASPKVDRAFARARELVRALTDPPHLIEVLLAEAVFSLMRGEIAHARQEGGEALQLAEQARNVGYALTCHVLLGAAEMYAANYGSAREHLEEVLALYDPVEHRDLAYHHGQDPAVGALSFLSRVLWLQGYPEQARAKADAALELAERLDHPYSHAVATIHAATLDSLLRQWQQCQKRAEQALELAREGQFRQWEANSAILHGLALAYQGRLEEGLAELSEGLFAWAASGAGLAVYGRACLAEVHLLAHRREEGLRAVDESLYPTQEIWWLPEQHRLRAELLLLEPTDQTQAESILEKAVDLARSQGSRLLELRAVTSLARLLGSQGRGTEGRDLLAQSYASFKEGYDLPDLWSARQLLEELTHEL